ncbi:uncharacterized protein N7496_011958 [Penicillium cataractarum]|uniref:Uncharacterized protein n=1 Tax=Penicillium cataractarum TaxID=2100454 RepID=A0A9W9UY74_9EURO|nr:uncharacterized protein N7496_011958 [Penicillium cataractarum]KAJ5359545.1 hypothetical protein N7496_011958 [Penicillium cataractarum]
MAFRPGSPFELPNGRLIRGPHRLGVCGICAVDYDFIYEDEDREEESDGPDYEVDRKRRESACASLASYPSTRIPFK